MSLILEALKKSEDKRRLGAAPDLATPFSAPRRRSWVWPLAALIVVAGVVAWALRPASPPPQPPAAAVPSKTKAQVAQATPTAGQKTGVPLHSVPGNNDVVQASPPDNLPKTEASPSKDGTLGQFVFGQPGTNAPAGSSLENRRADMQAARERRAANRGASAMTPPPRNPAANANGVANAPPSKTIAPPLATPKASASIPTPAASPKANMAAATPLPKPAAAIQPVAPAAAAESRAPKSSATVGLTPAPSKAAPEAAASNAQPYAELAFSVRKSLPELKLSMHVYAADPSHRFVVLNDSRLTEGQKTSDEIFVREIRPDGVVLEFQNQRFFYPRDGL
jgi:general secretion pathway protein B